MAAGKIGANAAPTTSRTSKPEQTAKPGAGAAPSAKGKPEQAGKPAEEKGASPKDRTNLSEESREGDKPGAGSKREKPGGGKELKKIRKDVEDLKKQLAEMEKPGEKGGSESGGGCQKGGSEPGSGGCQGAAPQAGASQEPGQAQGQPQDINSQLLSEAAQVLLMQGQLGGGQPGGPKGSHGSHDHHAAGRGQKAGKVQGGDARSNLARKYLKALSNPQTGQQIKPETHMLVQAALGIGGAQPAGGPQANPLQAGQAQKVPGLGTGGNPMVALAIAS